MSSIPIARRADKIVVGDRIPDEYLAFRFNQGPAQAVFVAHEVTQSLAWIFVAYRYPNGQHDSMTVRPEAVLEVYPGTPVGHDYSRADDGEQPGPVAGRIPPHFEDGLTVVEVAVEKPECGAWCADGPGGLCVKDLGHDGPHGDDGCPRCGHRPWRDSHGPKGCQASSASSVPCGCHYAEAG
jgi:hypothetical protein